MSKDTIANLCAGAISGIMADVSTHPLSTVKTRLQVEGAQSGRGARVNPISLLLHIGSKEGAGALFRGVGVVVAAAAPGQAMYFTGYEFVKKTTQNSPFASFASGVAAQLCGSLIWVPMDVVKERLQIEGQLKTVKNYGSSFQAVKGIIGTEGLLGLYRAFWIHQMTWAPFNGLYFATYDHSKKLIRDSFNNLSEITVNLVI